MPVLFLKKEKVVMKHTLKALVGLQLFSLTMEAADSTPFFQRLIPLDNPTLCLQRSLIAVALTAGARAYFRKPTPKPARYTNECSIKNLWYLIDDGLLGHRKKSKKTWRLMQDKHGATIGFRQDKIKQKGILGAIYTKHKSWLAAGAFALLVVNFPNRLLRGLEAVGLLTPAQ